MLWGCRLPRKGSLMRNDAELTIEIDPALLSGGNTMPRKAYESPRIQEWGSLLELTRGEGADFTDAEGGGSGAF
jgi:hypothetical protein